MESIWPNKRDELSRLFVWIPIASRLHPEMVNPVFTAVQNSGGDISRDEALKVILFVCGAIEHELKQFGYVPLEESERQQVKIVDDGDFSKETAAISKYGFPFFIVVDTGRLKRDEAKNTADTIYDLYEEMTALGHRFRGNWTHNNIRIKAPTGKALPDPDKLALVLYFQNEHDFVLAKMVL